MARIPQQFIDEVREKANIVDVVGQYVQLKKSGKNYLGLCPFHEEKTPSFTVAEDKQIFHCFGCGKGGNVYTFLTELEGISFPEAVVKVAEMENLTVPETYRDSNQETQISSEAQQLIKLHEKAAEVYHHMLVNTEAGQQAYEYLLARGLTEALIDEFQIGYAPPERKFLRQVVATDKVSDELMAKSGLFVQRDDGSFADRFYQRVMFPIRNPQGKTIGFSGRFMATPQDDGKGQAKYLNSPETELFNKSQVLFNFDKARNTIRKESEVFLFEGFMDVLAAWQSDVKNGIASMGTSLTAQQIGMISRVAKNIVICYDGDQAGINATNRAIELLTNNSCMSLDIVSIPEKLDPDDYVRKYGTEAFNELALHGRETVFAFKMRYHRQERNLNNEKEQLAYVDDLLIELAKVPSLIQQDRYLTQIATEFHISRDVLQQQFRQVKEARREQSHQNVSRPVDDLARMQPPPENYGVAYVDDSGNLAADVGHGAFRQKKLTQLEKAERLLLYRLFNDSHILYRLREQEVQFIHEEYQEIYFLLDSYIEIKGAFDLSGFLDFLKQPQVKSLVTEIANLKVPEETSEREIESILRHFRKGRLAEKIAMTKVKQQEASQLGNAQQALELAVEIINLTKQLKQA